jgi:hypothetical protein
MRLESLHRLYTPSTVHFLICRNRVDENMASHMANSSNHVVPRLSRSGEAVYKRTLNIDSLTRDNEFIHIGARALRSRDSRLLPTSESGARTYSSLQRYKRLPDLRPASFLHTTLGLSTSGCPIPAFMLALKSLCFM